MSDEKKLKWYEQLNYGWPFILAVVGGVVGAFCGAVALVLNREIFAKDISETKKYGYSFLICLGSIVAYLLIAVILTIAFPDFFGE